MRPVGGVSGHAGTTHVHMGPTAILIGEEDPDPAAQLPGRFILGVQEAPT
jgi:hypothetical protein